MLEGKNDKSESKKVEKNQEAAYSKVRDEVRELLVSVGRNDVQAKYKLGAIVLDVKDTSKYGDDAVGRMQKEFALDGNTLYRWAKVAETWPDAAVFKELASQVGPNDLPLTFSHWELIATVKDGRNRRGLITKALDNSLSVRALRKVISEGQWTEDKKSGGDQVVAIKHTKQMIDSIELKMRAWETDDLPKIAASIGKLTEKDLSDLRALRARLDRAVSIFGTLSDQIDQVAAPAKVEEQVAPKCILETQSLGEDAGAEPPQAAPAGL